jgi:hypothetical protein
MDDSETAIALNMLSTFGAQAEVKARGYCRDAIAVGDIAMALRWQRIVWEIARLEASDPNRILN